VLAYLSITLSHPRWLAARWLDRFGFEATEAWLQFDNTAAPLTLRANRLAVSTSDLTDRLRADGVSVRPGRFVPDALIVEEGHPLRGPDAAAGLFLVQDEASQLIALLAGEHPGARVLDTCAAPGGKTTALASAMENRGRLVACDVRPRRLDLLRQTVTASGAANVSLVRANLLHPAPFRAAFDCVLVDAPCSGLGTLRRDPDIRWRRQEGDLSALAAAQLTMLQHAAQAVTPGGRLVYATCSSEPEENEHVADAFLATTSDFAALQAGAAAPRLPPALVDARGHLRTAPHLHGLEAFFGAVFVRAAPSAVRGTNL
jgi:16S rRNA (cytosine967-C5)-methyltransferase